MATSKKKSAKKSGKKAKTKANVFSKKTGAAILESSGRGKSNGGIKGVSFTGKAGGRQG